MNGLGVRFVIVGRILRGRETVGYDLATYNCGRIPTRKEQVQILAQQGRITNAEAELSKGQVRLHGAMGETLSILPQRQLNSAEQLI